MLQLRPNCECCNRDLPPAALDARICSFECTFCADCTDTRLQGHCPNCGGELAKNPASTERVFKPQGCPAVITEHKA
jgi:hypothetical protein